MNATFTPAEIEHIHDAVNRNVRSAESDGIAADRLRSIVDRIEALDTEKRDLADDIKDIFTEAKSAGFDVKVLRRLIADRRKDAAEVQEIETMMDLYRRALGM